MEIARRDRQDCVRSTLMVRLARELDISHVCLKKACKRYGNFGAGRGQSHELVEVYAA